MEHLLFSPIVVNKGRKFKGRGYLVGSGGVSAGWAYTIVNAKIWDPSKKCIAYANQDYVEEDASVTPEQIEIDKQGYIDNVVDSTIAYCKSKSANPDSVEALQWIRNVLLKKLPKDVVDNRFPDQRGVSESVEKSLRWAMTLVSRPTVIYGKVCKGGKPYSKARKATIAYKQLKKNGIASRDGFEDAWLMWTSLLDLPDIRSKVDGKHLLEDTEC